MPKFGQTWFNAGYFGADKLVFADRKTTIRRIPVGLNIRGSIGDKITFRVRRGNGYYGSVSGRIYQDKYKYFVPSSINNAEGQSARNAYATAVSNWKNVLTDAQKKVYNKKASKRGGVSGYNLYLGEYIKANA